MKLALCAALIIIVGLCNAEDLLSEARWDLAGAAIWTSGTTYLVAFAGGRNESGISATVDLWRFHRSVQSWTDYPIKLSEPRYSLAAAGAGSVLAFGGGFNAEGPSAMVDLFFPLSNSSATYPLSSRGGNVIAAGASNSIAFAQQGFNENETVVDVYNAANDSWEMFFIEDRCYRAGSRKENITLLCNKGIYIFAENTSTWLLVPFSTQLTSESMDVNMQLNSAWSQNERATLKYAAATLFSPVCDEGMLATSQCAVPVAADSYLYWITGASGLPKRCQAFFVRSFPITDGEVDNSSSLHTINPRTGAAAVAFGETFMMAGGYILRDQTQCDSQKLPTVLGDIIDSYHPRASPPCKTPPNIDDIYCSSTGTDSYWVRSSPLTITANKPLTLTDSGVQFRSLVTLSAGAQLSIRDPATATFAYLELQDESVIHLYGPSLYSSFTMQTTSTVVAAPSARIIMDVLGSGGRGIFWLASPANLSQPLATNVSTVLQGFWSNEPGERIVSLIQRANYSPWETSLNISLGVIHWLNPRLAVQRYACETKVKLVQQLRVIVAESDTHENCGLVPDMLLVSLLFSSVLAFTIVALYRQVKPPPYSTPAPQLEEEETCSICLQACETPVLIKCKHRFCEQCIAEWTLVRNTCPVCRAAVRDEINLLLHSKGIFKISSSLHISFLFASVLWLGFVNDGLFPYFLPFFIIFVVFIFVFLVANTATVWNASRQMDRASVRPRLRYPWLSLLWYSVVIGPSVAIGVLCYSALQFRYINYMFVHGQPCSGPECYGLTPLWSERLVNAVGWQGYVANYTTHDWSDEVPRFINFRTGELVELPGPNVFAVLPLIGPLLVTMVSLSGFQVLLCIAHWTCSVQFQDHRYSNSIVRLALPAFVTNALILLVLGLVVLFMPMSLSLGCGYACYAFQGGPLIVSIALVFIVFTLAFSAFAFVKRLRSAAPAVDEISSDPGAVELQQLIAADDPSPSPRAEGDVQVSEAAKDEAEQEGELQLQRTNEQTPSSNIE